MGMAELGKSLSQPVSSTSSISKSQLGYLRRVKEKVAKQLNKNKELLAEVVVDNLGEGVEGYSKEVLDMMNLLLWWGCPREGMTKSYWTCFLSWIRGSRRLRG